LMTDRSASYTDMGECSDVTGMKGRRFLLSVN
jgi:hypothetical protein